MKSFRIKNIKAFKDSGKIEIKPITLFYGKNNTGKSSLIRFPLVLKQTMQRPYAPLMFTGIPERPDNVDYGTYKEVVFNNDESKHIEFELEVDYRKNTLNYLVNIQRKNGQLEVFSYKDRYESLEVEDGQYIFSDSQLTKEAVEVDFDGFFPKASHFINKPKTEDGRLLARRHSYLTDFFNQISYLSTYRPKPKRQYRFSDVDFSKSGAEGIYWAEILGFYHEQKNTAFFDVLNDWLVKNTGLRLLIKDLGSVFEIMVENINTKRTDNVVDIGSGWQFLLPILIQTFVHIEKKSASPFIKIIEEPEMHLHSSVQTAVADLFIWATQTNPQNRFMIETHSESILLRTVRRVMEWLQTKGEKGINPDDVIVYFIEKSANEEEGSKVTPFKINEKGILKSTLDGSIMDESFFDTDFEEVVAINKLHVSQAAKSQ